MSKVTPSQTPTVSVHTLIDAFKAMSTARAMSDLFEDNARLTAKYVHACSRGHEAIQFAAGRLLQEQDFLSAYYRDDCLLLSLGLTPEELMLQLFAKQDDPFSGGRTYYSHPSLNREGLPRIPHQSSATGMQAIPAAGVAMGLQYKERLEIPHDRLGSPPIVLCSIGDAAMTEGEVSEALHMADLKKLPIIWLVQDNEWDISAHASEIRSSDVSTLIKAFPNVRSFRVNGSDTEACLATMELAFQHAREVRGPVMVHADVPLLGHHTSGVRKEWYRHDLKEHGKRDPLPLLVERLESLGIEKKELDRIEQEVTGDVKNQFERAQTAKEPRGEDLMNHVFAPTPVLEEVGFRVPEDAEETLMVDCALHAMQEILEDHSEALLYGQDVGGRLGGVFREAATLAEKFGDDRVFNTPIQEAFIIGSTLGMSAAGLKPIVEVQFADYLWPGLNQLFTELSRSYFLSNGKWPVSSVIRVPIGAYGSGGPYHSSSIESILANIIGIKVVYPSNGADLKGLLKAAFYDPNPVVVLEHKGLYWSKIQGTEAAKCLEPGRDYRVPIGKGKMITTLGTSDEPQCTIITYGRGVYWAKEACIGLEGCTELLDLRSIRPLDFELIRQRIKQTHRALIITEEPVLNGFAQALAGRISSELFAMLDAPVLVVGSMETPAIPLNEDLERYVLIDSQKVREALEETLSF